MAVGNEILEYFHYQRKEKEKYYLGGKAFVCSIRDITGNKQQKVSGSMEELV